MNCFIRFIPLRHQSYQLMLLILSVYDARSLLRAECDACFDSEPSQCLYNVRILVIICCSITRASTCAISFNVDRHLGELMFYMEEIRLLLRRYDEVLQRYYVQFMYGFDSVVINEAVQNLSVCSLHKSFLFLSQKKGLKVVFKPTA